MIFFFSYCSNFLLPATSLLLRWSILLSSQSSSADININGIELALHCIHRVYCGMVSLLLRTDLRELQAEIVDVPTRRVNGFSLDYLVFNISGYLLYSIYSSIGFFTDIPGAGTVVVADLVFFYHALLMVAVQTVQSWIYPVLYRSCRKGRIGYLATPSSSSSPSGLSSSWRPPSPK